MLFDLQYTTAGPKILDKKHASLFLTQLFEELGIPIPKEQFSTILGNCMTEQDQFSFDLFRELVNEYLPDDRLTESLLIKIEDLEPLEPPTEKQEQLAEFLRSKDITEKTVITLDLVEEVMEKFTEPGEHTWSRSLTEELLYTFLQETYSPQSKEDISAAIEGNTVTISELCFLIRTLHPYFLSLEILLSTNRPKVRFGTIDRRCKCSILMAVCDSVICCSASGSVWSFHAHSRTPPTQLSNLRDIVSICCSRNFLFFLDINGTVWETPYDFKPGAAIKSNVPARPIEELPVIECFSSGTNHTVCVDCDGNAWMRGSIKSVQPEDSHIFKKIVQEGIELVLFVYCGPAFTFFLCDHGALYSVGLNPNWESYVPPVRTYQYNQKQTSKFDHVAERYTKIVDKSNIVSIACGFTHILFLLDDGAVLTCGRGNSGQLGAGADFQTLVKPSRIDVSDIQSIYASQDQSFCIDSQNRLWAFGGNSVGELGLGDTFFRWAPVLVPNFVARNGMSYTSDFQNLHHRFAIIADDCGDLWFFGQNSAPKKLPDDFSGICGYRQTFSKSARK